MKPMGLSLGKGAESPQDTTSPDRLSRVPSTWKAIPSRPWSRRMGRRCESTKEGPPSVSTPSGLATRDFRQAPWSGRSVAWRKSFSRTRVLPTARAAAGPASDWDAHQTRMRAVYRRRITISLRMMAADERRSTRMKNQTSESTPTTHPQRHDPGKYEAKHGNLP